MLYEDLSKKIVHAAHLVHDELKFGFLEAVYGNALYITDLRPEHEWQLINYLAAPHMELGLLINFGRSVKVRRKILTKEGQTDEE